MKKKFSLLTILSIVILISVGMMLSETMGHIPITHHHQTSICWGYAQGRAFGKTSGDAECDPVQTYAESIDETHFPYTPGASLAGIQPGDIVVFGQIRSGPNGHAAFVVEVPIPLVVDNIRVDQVPYQGGAEQTGVLLSTVKQSQGNPVGYHRGGGSTSATVTFRNSFNEGSIYVGKDKWGNWRQRPSGWSGPYLVGSALEIMAIDSQQDGAGNRQRFVTWKKDGSELDSQNPRVIIIPGSATYTAQFSIEWDVTFQNNFISGSGGQIKVNGQTHPAPHIAPVLQVYPSVTAQAIYNEFDRVAHTFAQWNHGNTTNPRTFSINGHATYTAHYNAKPLPPANIVAGGAVGSNVFVTWHVHPHTGVTQYQIWRKVKHQNQGTVSPPVLLATLPRTTTQFVDYDYVVTAGYTHDLVWYDVRSYFSLNGTYSDEYWTAVFADGSIVPKAFADSFVPTEWALSGSPNPFNPSTRLTYALPGGGMVSILIYDALGRVVTTLVSTYQEAGYYNVIWDGRSALGSPVSSGVYFARLDARDLYGQAQSSKTLKLLLAK